MTGHLASITSAAENTFIYNAFNRPGLHAAWIGLTDSEAFGGQESGSPANPAAPYWVWTNGDQATYTNWYPSAPNNVFPPEGEDFTEFLFGGNVGLWNDIQASYSDGNARYAIVEYDPPAPSPNGPVQWRTEDGGNGHYYELVEVPSKSWFDAKAGAEVSIHVGLAGHLASVGSAGENAFLQSTFSPLGVHAAWLGFTDNESYGGQESSGPQNPGSPCWVWTTGETVTYTNWLQAENGFPYDEPNNLGNQDFAAFVFSNSDGTPGRWDDVQGVYPDVSHMLVEYELPLPSLNGPVQWRTEDGGNGHYYELIPTTFTYWTDANNAATSSSLLGTTGHLASITSQAENEFIFNAFNQPGLHAAWIGLSDDEALGGQESYVPGNSGAPYWVWTTGEPVGYTNWVGPPHEAAPNNVLHVPQGEDYGEFVFGTWNGIWNDIPYVYADGNTRYALVEYDVPQPTFSWDVNGDGVYGDAFGENPTLTWAELAALGIDDGPAAIDVRVQINDGNGNLTISAPTTLTLGNVAPTIALSGNPTVDEGSVYTLTLGSITDPGADTVTQWIVNWGDGDATTYDEGEPVTHTFADGGQRTISVDLVDEDGMHLGAGSLAVHVANVDASDVSAGGPYTIVEGEDLVLYSMEPTPPSGPLQWRVEDGGNGHYYALIPTTFIYWADANNAATSSSYLGTSGHLASITSQPENQFIYDTFNQPGLHAAWIGLSDDEALGGQESYVPSNLGAPYWVWTTGEPVGYTNWVGPPHEAAPNNVLHVPQGEDYGEFVFGTWNGIWNDIPYVYSDGNTRYALVEYDLAQRTYSWDLNGDGDYSDAVGENPTVTWSQLAALGFGDGTSGFNIRVRVDDGNGNLTTSGPADLTIVNVPPSIALGGDATVDEGEEYTLTLGLITDPGQDTVTQWIVNWGDGTATTYGAGGPVTHTFADGGQRTITVDLVDEDGTHVGAGSLLVDVTPLPDAGGPYVVVEGNGVSLNATSFLDANPYSPGLYWVTWEGANRWSAYRSTLDGTQVDVLYAGSEESGLIRLIDIDPVENKIYYYGRFGEAFDNHAFVWRSHLDGSDMEDVITSGLVTLQYGFAIDSVQRTMYMGGHLYGIRKANLDGTGLTLFPPVNPLAPYYSHDMQVDLVNGKLYYTDELSFDGVQKVNLDGTSKEVVYSGPVNFLALDVPNNRIFFTDTDSQTLGVVGMDGSNPTAILTGSPFHDIELDTAHDKLYYSTPDGIYRANLDGSSAEHLVSLDTHSDSISLDLRSSLVNYSWDINGDGDFSDAVGESPTPSWSQLVALGLDDGPRSWEVRVRVDDGNGNLTTSNPASLTIVNTPPSIALDGDATVDEGEEYTLTLGSITDPGQDTVTQWIVNWGDGTTDTYFSGGPVTHAFADSGNRTITLDLVDEDGTHLSAGSISVAVQNLNPTLDLSGDLGADAGSPISIVANATDPSSVDQAGPFQFEVDWQSDGIVDELVNGSSASSLTHTYSSPGAFQVRVVAIDKDGGRSTPATWVVEIAGLELRPNASNPNEDDLFGYGTYGSDHVKFERVDSTTIRARWLKKNGQAVDIQQVFSGVAEAVMFNSGSGNDTIDASSLLEQGALLYGGTGNDLILGTQNVDTLIGELGDDSIHGNLGGDYIEGNDGEDLVYGENSNTNPPNGYVYGLDTITGGNGNDTIYGDADGGEGAADQINGGDGDDVIFGDGADGDKTGNDTILGGSGNDEITADGAEGASDIVGGQAGNDWIDTGGGNDAAFGDDGDDILIGGDGAEGANDSIYGGAGRDILIGDGGHPVIRQRIGGADVSDGGTGQDVVLAGYYGPEDSASLLLISLEWRSERSFSDRIANISGTGVGPRENEDYFLELGATVWNDRPASSSSSLVDLAFGGAEEDWLLVDAVRDVANDTEPTDLVTDLSVWPL